MPAVAWPAVVQLASSGPPNCQPVRRPRADRQSDSHAAGSPLPPSLLPTAPPTLDGIHGLPTRASILTQQRGPAYKRSPSTTEAKVKNEPGFALARSLGTS